jgi:hypothetical protein
MTTQTTPPAGGRHHFRPIDWLRQHPKEALAGGGLVAVGAVVAMHRNAGGPADTTGSGDVGAGSTAGYTVPQGYSGAAGSGSYDSTAADLFNSIEPILESLNTQLAGDTQAILKLGRKEDRQGRRISKLRDRLDRKTKAGGHSGAGKGNGHPHLTGAGNPKKRKAPKPKTVKLGKRKPTQGPKPPRRKKN